jgi:hypothetical protein
MRILAITLLLAACAGDDPTAPSAPSTLAVDLLGAGAHLTWIDNSDDEDEFVIMRRQSAGEMTELSRVPFDTVSYHDEPITSGTTYIYLVIATNAAGDSASNEATFVAP